MKELTAEAKKQITDDWAKRFPSLGIYQPMHLLRRVGPLLMGICLERDSSNRTYRPTFHVHNLCVTASSIHLTLWQPVRTIRTGSSERIQVRSHDERYCDAAERLDAQSPLTFSGDLNLSDVLAAYRSYIDRTRGTEHEHVDMVSLATWTGKSDLATDIVDRSMQEISHWNPVLIDRLGSLEMFRAKLKSIAADRDGLLKKSDEQIRTHCVENLPAACLLA